MALWQWIVDSIGAVLLLIVLFGFLLILRRRRLSRHGGTFELGVRVWTGTSGRGWALGLGRYSGENLEWFRIFTLSVRPKRVWTRSELSYDSTREPVSGEQVSLYGGHVIVVCQTRNGPIDLAMSPSALTGFQAWLEAAPPGAGNAAGG